MVEECFEMSSSGTDDLFLFSAAACDQSSLSQQKPEPAVPSDDVAPIDIRSTRPDTSYELLAEHVSGTTYTDETCKPGTVYYYKLQAVDGAGNVSADISMLL